jgi:hypothetical protein
VETTKQKGSRGRKNKILLLSPMSATLGHPPPRAVLMLWDAFLFLGLRFFPSFLIFARWSPLLFLVRKCFIKELKAPQSHVTSKYENIINTSMNNERATTSTSTGKVRLPPHL